MAGVWDEQTELTAIRGEYPAWLCWVDHRGQWHARRTGNFRQLFEPGAPRAAVHAPNPILLRMKLHYEALMHPSVP